MQKVLITGATGMLGAEIARHFANTNNYKVFTTGRAALQSLSNYIKADLLIEAEVDALLQQTQPDVIVHCAANVNLNSCEANADDAYNMHVKATKLLALYKPGVCKLVYISTDSVFNGLTGNYIEEDIPQPLNVYAITKLKGENAALTNANSLVLRTNIYGFNSLKKGNSLFEWIYANVSAGKSISGFSDVCFNPLYTAQLADVVNNSIQKNLTGIYHAGCEEKISKYDFLLMIKDAFGIDKSFIKNGNSDEIISNLKRPKNTTLNATALSTLLGTKYYLADGISRLKQDYLSKKNHEQHIY